MTPFIALGTLTILLALGIMWFFAHRIAGNRGLHDDNWNDDYAPGDWPRSKREERG
jgi:hypothetical protein